MSAAFPAAESPTARPLPPVTQLTIGSLVLVLTGGIFMASTFPQPSNLVAPILLLAGSAGLWALSLLLLARHRGFAWPVFYRVARWALLAYGLMAALIEYSFVHNHASGAPLLVLSLMLVMFALDVPLSIAFTVARYQSGPPD